MPMPVFKVKERMGAVRTPRSSARPRSRDVGRGRAVGPDPRALLTRNLGRREAELARAGHPLAQPAGLSGKLLRHAGGGQLNSGRVWDAVPLGRARADS